jgi:hypothetical protein
VLLKKKLLKAVLVLSVYRYSMRNEKIGIGFYRAQKLRALVAHGGAGCGVPPIF